MPDFSETTRLSADFVLAGSVSIVLILLLVKGFDAYEFLSARHLFEKGKGVFVHVFRWIRRKTAASKQHGSEQEIRVIAAHFANEELKHTLHNGRSYKSNDVNQGS